MTHIAVGLSLKGRFLLMEDDTTWPIEQLLDADGQETHDVDRCVGIVFQNPNGTYSVHEVREFEEMRIDRELQ